MAIIPNPGAPPDWCSYKKDNAILWHGCLGKDAAAILRHGVDPTKGRPDTDFGRGFYLTTNEQQSRFWAYDRYYRLTSAEQSQVGNHPVCLKFRVPRGDLSSLEALHVLVLPDFGNEAAAAALRIAFSARMTPVECCDPMQGRTLATRHSGGIAALNPRLIAVTPRGVVLRTAGTEADTIRVVGRPSLEQPSHGSTIVIG